VENDPYKHDPGHWGNSLATLGELVVPCLDAAGDVTRLLLDGVSGRGGRVWVVDPAPQPDLEELAAAEPDLELVRAGSLEALESVPVPDAFVIDGDHNYYTVSRELRLIAERVDDSNSDFPLLLFHDVCWPHGHRDDYFDPAAIPAEHRQPYVQGGRLYPGVSGIREEGGIPFRFPAEREGGPGNGIRTAVEDFVGEREQLRFAVVPAFFGFGAVWHRDAPWASAVAELLERWDRNPLLERLEANRVLHLASSNLHLEHAMKAQEQLAKQEELFRKMLESRAFWLAERVSWLHQRGKPAFTRAAVRRVLSD
jgi:hypothetical protein